MFRTADDNCSPIGNQGFAAADHVDAGHGEITIHAP
jgi:hypothetical protein